MRNMTRQLIYMVISLTYMIPSYGITFISGSKPIRNSDSYYWWIENNTNCEILLDAWLTMVNDKGTTTKYTVRLSKTKLQQKERTILSDSSIKPIKYYKGWLNIIQKSKCNTTRLIKIPL